MKIGVISDTHLRVPDENLERIVKEKFKDVSMILHAGDIVDGAVLEAFDGKDLVAVCGNMDQPSLCGVLPSKVVIEAEGRRIGMIHGWGSPAGIEDRIAREFENVDCVVFGHTHEAVVKNIDGVLFFNPGSPTDGRFNGNRTVGILDVSDTIEGMIIPVDFSKGII
ncbi:MAG TPA: metallophosphoesterase [Deltaproteobacteria bacterium]|nr:metallophosphoesterase [Deltaproteobacteria bacterium]